MAHHSGAAARPEHGARKWQRADAYDLAGQIARPLGPRRPTRAMAGLDAMGGLSAGGPGVGRRLVPAAVGLVVVGAIGLGVLVLASPSVANAPHWCRHPGYPSRPERRRPYPGPAGQALLATEDSRFYHDPALDPLGVGRAILGLVTGNGSEGGATIEQQLAKMLYAPGTNLQAELEQVGVAFRFDAMYTKAHILAMYLDAAYFGDGAYGCTAAAEHYFGVPPGIVLGAGQFARRARAGPLRVRPARPPVVSPQPPAPRPRSPRRHRGR